LKIAYFDCFSGASGDMILGALMDAGLSLERLKAELDKLGLDHFDLQVQKVLKGGISGSQALVLIDEVEHVHPSETSGDESPGGHEHQHDHNQEHHHDHSHHHVHGRSAMPSAPHQHGRHRSLSDIRRIIENSTLDAAVKTRSIAVFTRLAQAEAKVHQSDIEDVHFHEVGAMDAIIDVVGGVAGMAALGIEKIVCSPLHVGSGTVTCAHGTLPVPAPATAELIKGKPIYSTGVVGELLTPTGAAILTTLAAEFGPMPPITVTHTGYGAGNADPIGVPNLLRVSIGETENGSGAYLQEQTVCIETNIDDMNPQIYDYLIQILLDAGALDVFLKPVQMKKNRPGTLLSVICTPDEVGKFSDMLLKETTTIGMRWRLENRIKATRSIEQIDTPYGPVRVKVAKNGGRIINTTPEYEDCKRAAIENEIPLKKVLEDIKSTLVEKMGRTSS
jgi:hypothetical protein